MDNVIFPPLPGSQFNAYKAAHLLWKAGFGSTFEQAEKLAKLGLDAAVDQIVKYSATKVLPPGNVDAPPQEPSVAGPLGDRAAEGTEQISCG